VVKVKTYFGHKWRQMVAGDRHSAIGDNAGFNRRPSGEHRMTTRR